MKKRYLFPLLLVLLVLVPCAIASAASYYYVNGTSWLRVRQLPADDATILGSYRQDYAVTQYKKYNSDWAYVTFSDGNEGYVLNKYIKSSAAQYAWITTDDTILRTGPAKTFAKAALLPKGEKIRVLTKGSSWSYIYSTNYGYGYVSKTYLSSKAVQSETVYASFEAYVVNPNNRPVNLRAGAGRSYAVLAEIDPGTKVTVDSYGSTWSKITVNSSLSGYMLNEYLSRSSEVVTIGPDPAPTFAPDPTEAPFSSYTAYTTTTNGGKVNVRNGAGSGFGIVTQLVPGTAVTVVQHVNSTWYRINVNGLNGYVMSKYLTTDPSSGTGTHTAWVYTNDGKKLNVRNGMGSGYGIVKQLSCGTKVTVLEDITSSTWSHIKFGSVIGFVQSKFLIDYDPGIGGDDPEATTAPVSRFPFTAYVVSDNGLSVNIRRGAGTGYALAGSAPYGAQVTVTSEKYNYYGITYGSIKGYMDKKFITTTVPSVVVTPAPTADPASPTQVPATVTATVVSENGLPVKMRRGPGTGYGVRARINNGETVTVLGQKDGWTKISYNGLVGYMMPKFLR